MRICLLLILGCLFSTGCRVNPRAEREIALLRAEILDLEDQYYSLKSRCEAGGDTYYDSGDCLNCDSNSIIYEDAPGSFDSNIDDMESINSIIEDPIEDTPANNSENGNNSASVLRFVPHQDEKLPRKVSYSRERSATRMDDGEITSVSINRRISKGEDLDGAPGHEGITLLIQPKDSRGAVQKRPGHITVSVTEPLARNQRRQIGLWQFTPEESASFFVKDDFAQQGILLHLPWDESIPRGNRLNVMVRYSTNDQRPFQANTQIGISPPPNSYSSADPLVAQWIDNDARWADNADEFEINVNEFISESESQFRDQSPTRKQRISAPGWRPVR